MSTSATPTNREPINASSKARPFENVEQDGLGSSVHPLSRYLLQSRGGDTCSYGQVWRDLALLGAPARRGARGAPHAACYGLILRGAGQARTDSPVPFGLAERLDLRDAG
jgi:hypothetical protein